MPYRLLASRLPRWGRADASALVRRLAQFWLVWSALLLLHEGGHAVSAWRQGLGVRRVTVGVGPVLWRGRHDDTQIVLRAVPLAGMTTLRTPKASSAPAQRTGERARWRAWADQAATLAGGIVATLGLAIGVSALVAARERVTGRRWTAGRVLVADAVVLTVFNFLPVPPLDGGRALLGALAAWRGAPLAGDALFWVQVGGLALAVAPMTLWTRWTERIDAAALWWGAPTARR
jgi:membrane-associated protease RseP (regulator of RpoE activity)